jgi:hypothetical protein
MPEIRFGRLPHGQHFRWRGREWTKVGPLLAQRKGRGDTVMLRRSTLVKVKDGSLPAPDVADLEPRPVPPQELTRLYHEITRLTERLPLQEPDRERFVAEMRKHFLAVLNSSQLEESV